VLVTIAGTMVNYGKVIVANGSIILEGSGALNNQGDGEVILVALFNTPTFNTTSTIQMSSTMTVNGPSVSAVIVDNSITTNLLNIVGSLTASYILSNDGFGSFQWVPNNFIEIQAGSVSYTPGGPTLTSLNVQDALDEVDASVTDQRTIIVKVGATTPGQFSSIKAAVDSITDSSPTNGYVINVGPGEFYEEEINFTGKPYISVVGSDIQITKIIATSSTQNLFVLNNSVELSFMTLKGVGPGYTAVVCEDLDGFALIHKVSMYDCDTMVLVRANSLLTQFYGEYIDFNGEYSYGIKVESNNGAYAFANAENYYNFSGVTGSICNYASGTNSIINILGSVNTGFGNDTAYLF